MQVEHAVRFDATRSTGQLPIKLENLDDDQVMELTFDGNLQRWLTVAEFKTEFGESLTRDRASGDLTIPPVLNVGSQRSRGIVKWALKALRIFNVDPIARGAEKTAEALAAHIDNRAVKEPGLYIMDSPEVLGPKARKADISGTEKALVFLHGTVSSTQGSFGKMTPVLWEELRRTYGDRIFGFNHHTLSKHPVENALDLIGPANDPFIEGGTELHLVSTSRGGLIGELMARGTRIGNISAFDADDLALFEDHPDEIKGALADLNTRLATQKIKIGRFVRIACPSGGTTLASNRLDKWLEGLLNVLGLITGAKSSDMYWILTEFLMGVKKSIIDVDDVPGLACQNPGSSLIRMLNRSDVTVDSSLSVIAGDIQGKGVFQRLGVFLADLFYREDHDLVIPTRAMYGGAHRKDAYVYFDKGAEVNHFSYFKNEETSDRIASALMEPSLTFEQHGFVSLSDTTREQATQEISRSAVPERSGFARPSVFVVPGIMGSHLSINGNRIWLDFSDLALGRMDLLRIDNHNVEPQAPVAMAYARLVNYLGATHDVIPFPYDWRKSMLDEAARFNKALARQLEQSNQPVRILAHSMGGLVARIGFAMDTELWQAFTKRKGNRLVMLGTPTQGSYLIPQVLTKRSLTFKALAAIDIRHSAEDLLQIVSRYPGLLELLPSEEGGDDFFTLDTWKGLMNRDNRDWVLPEEADLQNARTVLDLMARAPISKEHMVYVAGCDRRTPKGIKKGRSRRGLRFIGTARGDGSVTWDSGIPAGVNAWYMEAKHGDLADTPAAFAALFDLLHTGETKRLSATPPAAHRGTSMDVEMEEEELEVYPNQADLETITLGMSPQQEADASSRISVQVSVMHGDLAFCGDAIAVGHYESDGLFSAERHLDHLLDRRLSARYAMGIYPGPEGSVEVILERNTNLKAKPSGAIIIGLGRVGELSPQKLSNAFTQALLKYAVSYVELYADPSEKAEKGIRFSTLLVGSGEEGVSLKDAVGAILRSVKRANSMLLSMKPAYPVYFEAVRFVELYKDRAVEALHSVKGYMKDPSLQSTEMRFAVASTVDTTKGSLRRITRGANSGWWRSVHVRSSDNGETMIFTTSQGRARAEESALSVQRRNIDLFVEQAVHLHTWDRKLSSALFEMLIPNRLKQYARDQNSVLMVVDADAARYPWELLHDRRAGVHPLVTEVGFVRQLATSTFREQVEVVPEMRALVVGNPDGTAEDFSNLPGAEQEAIMVADVLQTYRFEVVREINKDAVPIMASLLASDYKIVHLAGHGVHNYLRKDDTDRDKKSRVPISGMVLSKGVFITANELRQMQRVPDLVFVNCCFLGTIDEFPSNAFAASFAQELIQMGVRAVVAAGWAIDDTAALTFSDTFYRSMLNGAQFGEAVKAAREETYTLHGDRTNTWGAYQCYGDPTYTLIDNPVEDDEASAKDFVDIEELLIYIENFCARAQTSSWRDVATLQSELRSHAELFKKQHQDWMEDVKLNEMLGKAYAAVNLFEEAVAHYKKAQKSNAVSLKTIEQWANIRVRHAVTSITDETYERAIKELNESIDTLEKLNAFRGPTPERLSIIGSSYKRFASIAKPQRKRTYLNEMVERYAEAAEQSSGKGFYPLTNMLYGKVLLHWLEPEDYPLDFKLDIDGVVKLAKNEMEERSNDFWVAVAHEDISLVDALYDAADTINDTDEANVLKTLETRLQEIGEAYKQAWNHFGAARELSSVIDQVKVICDVFESEPTLLDRKIDKNEVVRLFNVLKTRLTTLLEAGADSSDSWS